MAHRLSAEDLEFRKRFEACKVKAGEFDQRAHLRLAYAYLAGQDAETAYERVSGALHGFLECSGIDPSKYHDTMTRAPDLDPIPRYEDESVSTEREGGCACGAIRYRIDGTIDRTTTCHCEHCRKTSGAPCLTWIEVAAERFAFVCGTPASYESRPQVVRRFCADCGTQLTYEHAAEPAIVDITAGSLDRLEGIAPQDHVWADRMAPWVDPRDGLPRYARGRFDGEEGT